MSISNLAKHWIEMHKEELEVLGDNYTWIPGECRAYNTLEEVANAFGEAGIEPFNLYQGKPKGLYKYIWYSQRNLAHIIFVPEPVPITSTTNYHAICQANAKICKALGLEVFKYKGDIDLTKNLCPYIVVSANQVQEFKDKYLEGYRGFVYSTRTSDYDLVNSVKDI